MKSTRSYLVTAFVIAFSVLLVIPLWAAFGVLLPEEGGHGGGEMMMAGEFRGKVADLISEHGLPDGSVEAGHGEPVYVMVSQYTFSPNTIRLKTGEHYVFKFLSVDVVHALSVQMGGTSFNAVVMPMMVTEVEFKPTQPGNYLTLCNEYCGIGHEYMYFNIIVEEAGEHDGEDDAHAEDDAHDE